jgi:ubiquinone/menaquinone biosynthesis C-methylase UbiE
MIMEFDKYAAGYDEGFMGKGSSRFYIDLVKELDVKDGDRILDVGCGTGTVLNYVSKKNKITGFGIDVSESMVDMAKGKETGCEFAVGDAGDLQFEDASMDVITACMAYHHFPDQQKFRKEALRVLKSGGSLYICDPRFPAPVRWIFNTFFRDAGFYSPKKNVSDFEKNGFVAEKIFKDAYVQVLKFKKV